MIPHDSKALAFGHTNITLAITVHCIDHCSLFTVHFELCLFKGGCPLSFSSGLLSQREFLVVRLSLREFLTFLLPYKACNLSQFLSLVTVYLLTTYIHYYYCKCDVLFSIKSIFSSSTFSFMFIILFVATATLDGLPPYRTVLNCFHSL